MGIQVMWDDERKWAVRYVFAPKWSWEDLKNAFRDVHMLMDTVDYPVHSILDMTQTNALPEHAITQIGKIGLSDMAHKNQSRLMVLVGMSAFVRAIISAAGKVFKPLNEHNDLRFVKTLEEARKLVEGQKAGETSNPT
jgi:hypothetical protein